LVGVGGEATSEQPSDAATIMIPVAVSSCNTLYDQADMSNIFTCAGDDHFGTCLSWHCGVHFLGASSVLGELILSFFHIDMPR
jgi:hypothetical protein